MKIRILLPADMSTTYPRNPYLQQLMQALLHDDHVELAVHGPIHLFHGDHDWDVVHIQWPEALIGWKDELDVTVEDIDKALARLGRRALIVHTVHNSEPKEELGDVGVQLYRTVFHHTDVFVHLGKRSRDMFLKQHAQAEWAARARHVVIPHGNYDFYKSFKPPDKPIGPSFVTNEKRLLVFGELRSRMEEELARQAFVTAAVPKSRLVFAGALAQDAFPADVRAQLHNDGQKITRLHKRIPDRLVAPLFESCRAVFIPRSGRLNSGVVALAFTFGIPVIAPDEAVIGEMSRKFGQMVYAPGDATAAAAAIRKALSLSRTARMRLRDRILEYSATMLAWPRIARKHRQLYLANIARKKKLPLSKRLRARFGS